MLVVISNGFICKKLGLICEQAFIALDSIVKSSFAYMNKHL